METPSPGVDEFLDDATHAAELGEVRVAGLRLNRQLHLVHRRPDVRLRLGWQAHDGVALTREALVELDDDLAGGRTLLPQFVNRPLDVELVAQVFGPLGQIDAGFAKHAPAAGLGAVIRMLWIESVQRNAQKHGQFPFERRRVEDREVRLLVIGNRGTNALDEPGPFDNLLGERTRRRVVATEHRHPRQGMRRRNARKEMQVVPGS